LDRPLQERWTNRRGSAMKADTSEYVVPWLRLFSSTACSKGKLADGHKHRKLSECAPDMDEISRHEVARDDLRPPVSAFQPGWQRDGRSGPPIRRSCGVHR